jgi:hypothetical protein
MITLNNKIFIKKGEQNDSAVGYYKIFKKYVDLYNLNNEKIGVVTCRGVIAKATPLNEITRQDKDKGKWWYSFATIDELGEYSSYSKEQEEIINTLKLCNITLYY